MTQFGTKHLILVGDRKQLPPTLSTPSLHNNGLEKTLFERLILNGVSTMTLRTQYRVKWLYHIHG
jgi:superfamily I DNA and/or RNA helicase